MTYQEELQAIKDGYNEAKLQKEVLGMKPNEISITADWLDNPYAYIWAQGFNRYVRGEELEKY